MFQELTPSESKMTSIGWLLQELEVAPYSILNQLIVGVKVMEEAPRYFVDIYTLKKGLGLYSCEEVRCLIAEVVATQGACGNISEELLKRLQRAINKAGLSWKALKDATGRRG